MSRTADTASAHRTSLASEREAALAAVVVLEAEHAAIVEGSAQANLDDEHDPEGATVGFERARVASLLEAARRRVALLDDAAERLATGRYGVCARCGRSIAAERLEAEPAAATCVGCAEAPQSLLRRRP